MSMGSPGVSAELAEFGSSSRFEKRNLLISVLSVENELVYCTALLNNVTDFYIPFRDI